MRQNRSAWLVVWLSIFLLSGYCQHALAQDSTGSCATPLNLVINGKARQTLIQGVGQNCSELARIKGAELLQEYAIVISDARTGELIWSAGSNKKASLTLSGMKYRVVAGITVVDLNLDGYGDQIIFVDAGGQLWRLLVNHRETREGKKPVIGESTVDSGVMAVLSGSELHDRRSFYTRPVVGYIQDCNHSYLMIGIGSGSPVLPQGKVVKDRFYALRTRKIHSKEVSSISSDVTLVNRTPGVMDERLSQSIEDGWFIDLPGLGEKILTATRLANGYVGFVTYQPSPDKDQNEGVNHLYVIDAVTGEEHKRIRLKNRKLGVSATIKLVDRSQLSEKLSEDAKGPVFALCVESECTVLPGQAVRQTGWFNKRTNVPVSHL